MDTILVPTDFSPNAMAGMRMALDMAVQMQAKLLFVYVKGTSYSPVDVQGADSGPVSAEEDKEDKKYLAKLEELAESLFLEKQNRPPEQSFAVIKGVRADAALLNYMDRHGSIDYIVLSTRGAGNRVDRFLGTNTGNLITKSHVPVVAVPVDHKPAPFSKLLYATDFSNYMKELGKIVPLAKQMDMAIEILHFVSVETHALVLEKEEIEEMIRAEYGIDLSVYFENKDVWYSLVDNLQRAIEKHAPSLVALFTNQHRSFFQKMFLSSMAEELSFHTTVPLLVFNK